MNEGQPDHQLEDDGLADGVSGEPLYHLPIAAAEVGLVLAGHVGGKALRDHVRKVVRA